MMASRNNAGVMKSRTVLAGVFRERVHNVIQNATAYRIAQVGDIQRANNRPKPRYLIVLSSYDGFARKDFVIPRELQNKFIRISCSKKGIDMFLNRHV